MSNALAIAAVTAVLKDLLENGLVSDSITTSVGDVMVTALPPDRISIGADERAQLNLFLYQVTQNRSADWVYREHPGLHTTSVLENRFQPKRDPRLTNPPLALDLHYLLTAYGAKDFQAEILLGYAMQLLHEMAVLTRDVIYTALKNAASVSTSGALSQALAAVSPLDLADQVGQIKICPEFFNMEETSKLWSALQTHYRPSAAYQASMVLIESRSSDKPGSPYKIPFCQPLIEQVITPIESDYTIVAGSMLLIRGQRLRGEATRARLSGTETLLVPQDVKETQLSLLLPPDLPAGLQGLQVVHLLPAGATRPLQHEVGSNLVAFVLHPTITATVNPPKGRLKKQVNNSSDLRSVEITVKFNPDVGQAQRVVLLLNEVSSCESMTYSFPVASRTSAIDTITVPITTKLGTYWVRVQVDGAESPLKMNQAREYDAPQITVS